MLIRFIQKTVSTIKDEGIFQFFKTVSTLAQRKLNSKKYFHFVEIPEKKKFLLFVSGEPKNSTSFYRCEVPKEQLEGLGYEVDILYKDFVSKEYIKKYEHVIWYRMPFRSEYREMIGSKKIIFSVDDLIFDDQSIKVQPWIFKLHKDDREKLLNDSIGMMNFVKKSDMLITSTEYLAHELNKHSRSKILVNRNSYSKKQFETAESIQEKSEHDMLGFVSGSFTHNENLEMISESIERIMFKRKNLKLKLMGRIEIPNNLKRFTDRIIMKPFQNENEFLKEMKSVSVVLMPLIKNAHNESKSELRAIQAGILQVPIIATDTYSYKSIISDGNNGFLVSKTKDWYDIIDKALNSDLEKMGKRLYSDVINKYNPVKLGKELITFLEENDK